VRFFGSPPAVVAGLFALLASSSALAQDYSCTPTNFSVWTAQYNNQRTGANTSEGCLTPTNAGSGTMAQQLQLLHALRAKHALAIEPDRCRVLLGELHRRLRLQPGLRSAALRLPSYGYRRDRRHGEYCRCRDANRPGLRLRRHCHAEHNQPVQRIGALGKMVLVSKLLGGGSSGDCYSSDGAGAPIPAPGPSLPAAGILSTPVAYLADNVVYVVGGCKNEATGGIYRYLHGLSLADGTDEFTPVAVGSGVYAPASPNVAGVSPSGCTTNCVVKFAAQYQLQRPALLLDKGEIYIGFGVGNGSETEFSYPYHGWLIGYPTSSIESGSNFAFAATTILDPSGTPLVGCTGNTSPPWTNECGLGGGHWRNPAVFSGSSQDFVLAAMGNGGFQAPSYGSTTAYSYCESVVSFTQSTTCNTSSSPTPCAPNGFFTPSAFGTMNANDEDMGGSGILVTNPPAPQAPQLVTFDKSGQGYALNSNPSTGGLTGYNTTDCTPSCEFAGSLTSPASGFSGPCYGGLGNANNLPCDSVFSQVYFDGYLFLWPRLEDFDWCYPSSGTFVCDPQTGKLDDDNLSPSGFPGGTLTLSSSSGTDLSTAILWGVLNPNGANPYVEPDAAPANFAGHLRAYQLVTAPSAGTAFDVTKLWTSVDKWLASVFALPIVANGSVHVPTYDNGVVVYHP